MVGGFAVTFDVDSSDIAYVSPEFLQDDQRSPIIEQPFFVNLK